MFGKESVFTPKIAYAALCVSEVWDYPLSYGFSLVISEWDILWVVTILRKSGKCPCCSKRSCATLGMASSAEMYLVQRFWPRRFRYTWNQRHWSTAKYRNNSVKLCIFGVFFANLFVFSWKNRVFFEFQIFKLQIFLFIFRISSFVTRSRIQHPKSGQRPLKRRGRLQTHIFSLLERRRKDRLAHVRHVCGVEISQISLSLATPGSGLYVSCIELLPGCGELSTCRWS